MTGQPFDEQAWRDECQAAGVLATTGAGLSETMFHRNMHSEVQRRLGAIHEQDRQRALEIAQEFGYATADELAADDRWNQEHGYCTHGIELGHCPVGCDDHE